MKTISKKQKDNVVTLYQATDLEVYKIAKICDVSTTSVTNILKERRVYFMSRTYEFLQDRMSFLNEATFNRYYGIKKYYQFTPKVSDVPKLEKYIMKETDDVVREMLNRPVITVEVKKAEEPDKFIMEWSVGFEGMELKVGCFSISEELYNLEEIENVAMWMTHMNIQELNWKQAVDKLHKIFKEQSK